MGYLVGSSVTLADVSLLHLLLAGVDYFGDTFFDKYPDVKVNSVFKLYSSIVRGQFVRYRAADSLR